MDDAPSTAGKTEDAPPAAAPGEGAAARVAAALDGARAAQAVWAARPLSERLGVVRRLRALIAERPEALVSAVGDRHGRLPSETLTAEIIPLAEACRFLEREAPRLLAPRRLGRRGRPLWLSGVDAELRREPLGVVLILAPGNYRLFLAGTQIVQALAAGNAVLAKPAPGAAPALRALAALAAEAGLPPGLLAILDEDVETARAAVAAPVDKVVLTGSAATGRAVLAALAPRLTPSVMELSGADAVFVLAGADPQATADALVWGLALNGGATCIAPRRVFVAKEAAEALEAALAERLARAAPRPVDPEQARRAAEMLAEAADAGLRIRPEPPAPGGAMRPTMAFGLREGLRLMREDPFAPVAVVAPVDDMDHALALDALCPYALGAAVLGPEPEARALAARLRAGVVTVNDLIAPTADPRLPFGGRGESGFGLTRGAEGLLEMTALKSVAVRRGAPPQLAPAHPSDARLFAAFLLLSHGRGAARLRGAARVVRALAGRVGHRPK